MVHPVSQASVKAGQEEKSDSQRGLYEVAPRERMLERSLLLLLYAHPEKRRKIDYFRVYVQMKTRWLYCVECPQYSIRLEALGYLR